MKQTGTNYYPLLERELLIKEVQRLWQAYKKQEEAIMFLLIYDTNGQEDG